MEAKVLEKIAAQQEKTIKLLSRLSEQKQDEKIEVDKKTAFVKNRIFQVRTDSAIPNVSQDPAFFIHVIPAEFNFKNVLEFAPPKIYDIMNNVHPWFEGGCDYLYNFDGFATYIKDTKGEVRSYSQILRNGIAELYVTALPMVDHFENLFIDGARFFGMLNIRLGGIINALIELNFNTKYDVYFSFVNCKNVAFLNNRLKTFPMSQDFAYLPPVQIEASTELNNQPNYTRTLNHIAQNFGMSNRYNGR